MAISVFPAPTASSGASAFSITAAAANTVYRDTLVFSPAIYRVSCIAGTISTVDFFNGNTFIVRAVTASGTIDVSLGSEADNVRFHTNTGTNVIVTITKLADILIDDFPSRTLDTVTSTGTYTGTSASGFGYAIVIGGGGSGGSITGEGDVSGGGAGGMAAKIVALTGSMAVTIGAGGTSVTNTVGLAGGNSTFAGMTANGGSGGVRFAGDNLGTGTAAGGTATGGIYNITGGRGAGRNATAATASDFSPFPFVSFGNIGGGNGIYNSINLNAGKTGNTLGVGGGGNWGTNGSITNATGYGAGGGGAANNGASGIGAPGVVFVLKY